MGSEFQKSKGVMKAGKDTITFSMQNHKIMERRPPVKKLQKACDEVIFI